MGFLYPVSCMEVLPGDTFQQNTSLLVRCSPLLAPVMHPVTVRVHHFYVPTRLVWDKFEKFITGGSDGMGDDAGTPPVTESPNSVYSQYPGGPEKVAQYPEGRAQLTVNKGSLADYFGLPVGLDYEVSALPFLAYSRVWEDYFADQDFESSSFHEFVQHPHLDWGPFPVCWEKDYFTTSRPWPQKGPDVVVPLGGMAPVIGDGIPNFYFANDVYAGGLKSGSGDDHRVLVETLGPSSDNWLKWNPTGTALSADLSGATASSINDLRRAFALQRYAEARAQYGSRYTEYLAYLGIRSSDARMNRAEFLGGGKQTISFSEVLQTGPSSTSNNDWNGVSDLYGHGIAAMRSNRYRRFFEEHGFVISVMSVRPKAMYMNGVGRMWTRETKEDYFQRELESIGQQEVHGRELHYADTNQTWGYSDRYAEYRSVPSTVAGDFRDNLDYWHLARNFGSTPPALNGQFLSASEASPRIFADQVSDHFWIMAYHNVQARRMVRRTAIGRMV